jgi:hypothetical protein
MNVVSLLYSFKLFYTNQYDYLTLKAAFVHWVGQVMVREAVQTMAG